MDSIKYLNSRDIAQYLKSIDFEFNAMQAAYVIYINQWLTIEERLRLWREIISTMPDCEFQFISNKFISIKPSAHTAILEHIQKVESDLASFLESNDAENQPIYAPIAARWKRRPKWLKPKSEEHLVVGGSVWNDAIRAMPFTTLDNCKKYLEKENEHFKRCGKGWGEFVPFDRYRIGRTPLNGRNANCYKYNPDPEPLNYFLEAITLNGNFEPIGIKMDWYGNVFENIVSEIPHPFKGGDILIDMTKSEPLPFVFDRCVTWTLEDEEEARQRRMSICNTLRKKGIQADEYEIERLMDLKECNLALGDRCSVLGACYFAHGHMFAYGYELKDATEKTLLQYSWGGASDNYLNLEYYNGPFDGKLAIMPVVSWFVMNEDRMSPDILTMDAKGDDAKERFLTRKIDKPDASTYDICSLVNAAFRLG